jgi:hypothetical protein
MKINASRDGMLAGSLRADMSVTIFYRHRQRPDVAGMTRVPNDAYAETLKDQLESRGFQVIEVVPARTAPSPQLGADD